MSEAQAAAAAPESAPPPTEQGQVQSAAPTAPAPQAPPEAAAPAAAERPAWLPEKFGTPEALAAAYAELEKKLGGGQQKPADPPAQQLAPKSDAEVIKAGQEAAAVANLPDPASINDADAGFVLAQRGLDVTKLTEEYTSKGGLSDETYGNLEKAGLPRPFVDAWIAGREATAQAHAQRLFEEAGGEKEFRQVQAWARVNLPPAELKGYNDAVAQGNLEIMALAIRGLHARYVASVGQRPELLGGDTSTSASEGYSSQDAVVKAMSDPRYRTDPAYRAEVERKLSAKQVLNVRVTR